jgi:predicted house-cleaning noncanonical NTP pyrophosphatase (MazG superfamily)
LEEKLREKGKIDSADQTELDKEDLSRKINEAISIFSEIGYLDEVAEVCQIVSNIFSIAAFKSRDEEFSRRADRIAKVWSERAKFEKASIGLRPDLMVTAETVRFG